MPVSLIGQAVTRIGIPLLKAARGGKKVLRLDVEFPGAVSSSLARGKSIRGARGRFTGKSQTRITTRNKEGRILGTREVDPATTRAVQRSNPLVRSTIRGFRRQQEFAAQHPIANILSEVGTAVFVAPPVANFGIDFFSDRKLREEIESQSGASDLLFARRIRAERIQRSDAANLATLAALRPEIYNAIAARGMLPRGAVVIGGQPDYAGLEAVASGMSSGAFTAGPSAEEAFLNELR